MRPAVMIAAVAATLGGATSALAQAPQESTQDPTITQNAPNAPSAEQSDAQGKARMPIRRELPLVPDKNVAGNSASEGAGAGTSGSDNSGATKSEKMEGKKY